MSKIKKCKYYNECYELVGQNGILCEDCLIDPAITATTFTATYILKLRAYDLFIGNITIINNDRSILNESMFLVSELLELADKQTKNLDSNHLKRKRFLEQEVKYEKLKKQREKRFRRKKSIMDNINSAFMKYDAPFNIDNYGIKLVIKKYLDNQNLTDMEATYGIIGEIENILSNNKKYVK